MKSSRRKAQGLGRSFAISAGQPSNQKIIQSQYMIHLTRDNTTADLVHVKDEKDLASSLARNPRELILRTGEVLANQPPA
jgi:hypothetical protein